MNTEHKKFEIRLSETEEYQKKNAQVQMCSKVYNYAVGL